MTLQQALLYIANAGNRIFSVEFRKRSTNELRQIVCRTGVKVGLKNGPAAYDPALKNLIWVWDMQKNARRSIAAEGITRIKVPGGEWEEVVQPEG